MCGGGGGGDGGGDDFGDETGGRHDGTKGGEGKGGGTFTSDGSFVDNPGGTGRTDDQGNTFNFADSTFGKFLGDTRSDASIRGDVAVSEGRSTFVGAGGKTQSTEGYSRGLSAPTPGGVLSAMNPDVTAGGVLGAVASTLIGGPVGFLAGQGVKAGVNSLLGGGEADGKTSLGQ